MMSLKKREEQKREKAVSPEVRWKQIQEMIAWAEVNMRPEHKKIQTRLYQQVCANKKN